MASLTISIPDPLHDWVRQRVDLGFYATSSDYVSALIRLDRQMADGAENVVQALLEGEGSGTSPRRMPEILKALKHELSEAADA